MQTPMYSTHTVKPRIIPVLALSNSALTATIGVLTNTAAL
jgi:hypothetical protein